MLGMRGMASTLPEGWSVLVGMPAMVSAVSGTLDVVVSPPRLHVRAGTRSDVDGASTGTVWLPISVGTSGTLSNAAATLADAVSLAVGGLGGAVSTEVESRAGSESCCSNLRFQCLNLY